MSRVQLARLTELAEEDDAPAIAWSGDEDLLTLAERMRNVDRIANVAPPKGLRVRLRDYQQQGLDWLQFLREYRLAGVLADSLFNESEGSEAGWTEEDLVTLFAPLE